MNIELLNFVLERKSVRKYDPTDSIPDHIITSILETGATAPSSNNSQPWKVVVITNKEIMKKLRTFSLDQESVENASALFFILGDLTAYNIDMQVAFAIENGILPKDNMTAIKAHKDLLETHFQNNPEDRQLPGLNLDTGLFSMNVMHAARVYGYDTLAMRGVEFEKVKKYLNIDSKLVPILLLAVGKSIAPGHEKKRKPLSEFTTIFH